MFVINVNFPGENINVSAAFIHVLGDFIQSVGVFLAAIVIFFKVLNISSPWALKLRNVSEACGRGFSGVDLPFLKYAQISARVELDWSDLHICIQLPRAVHNRAHPQVILINLSHQKIITHLPSLRKTMTVLLEATPSNINFDLVKNTFLGVKVLPYMHCN